MNSSVMEEPEIKKSQGQIIEYVCRKRKLEAVSMADQDELHAKQKMKVMKKECLDQLQTDKNLTTLCVSRMIEKNNKFFHEFKEGSSSLPC